MLSAFRNVVFWLARRNLAGRAARARGVDLDVPLGELTREVFAVGEAPALEEAAFDPADQVLDGALGSRGAANTNRGPRRARP